MKSSKANLINQWSYDGENADKPTEQSKTRLLQSKVSPARLREIDYVVSKSDRYNSRSELVRTAVTNQLHGGSIEIREETLSKAHQIKRLGGYPSVEVVLHEAVCRVYDEVIGE
jgi:Arc/MetJ-type ribon-helix-helix transcriptional regulator